MNKDLHIEFDFDEQTGLYAFILKFDGRVLQIDMDIEQFESISSSMIRLVKDVNLMLAKKYQERVAQASYPLLDDDR